MQRAELHADTHAGLSGASSMSKRRLCRLAASLRDFA